MTIIEVLVTLAIVGAMMGISVGVVRSIFDVEMEKAARELSAAMRYVYGESIRRNEIYRFSFNLDEEKYGVESAPNSPEVLTALALSGSEEEERLAAQEEEASTKPDESAGDTLEDEASEPPPSFAAVSDAVLRSRSLGPILIKDIFLGREEGAISSGTVYLYFFPNGSSEYAIINLSDEEEESFFSIELNPVTGNTKIRDVYYEKPY